VAAEILAAGEVHSHKAKAVVVAAAADRCRKETQSRCYNADCWWEALASCFATVAMTASDVEVVTEAHFASSSKQKCSRG